MTAQQFSRSLGAAPPLSRLWPLAVLAILAFSVASPGHAALIHDLSVSGNFSGTGQIIFTSDVGNSVAGVSAFDFTVAGNAGGLPNTTFGLGDINAVEWSIDPSDWSLTLFLQTSLVAAGSTSVSLTLNNEGALRDDLCGALGQNDGSTYCGPGILVGASTLQTAASEEPVSVPEPSSIPELALLLFGLAVPAFVPRKTKHES